MEINSKAAEINYRRKSFIIEPPNNKISQSPNIDSVLEKLSSIENYHFDPEKLVRECRKIPKEYCGKYAIDNKLHIGDKK